MQHPEAGGAEVHAHEIFRRLAARGHEITFLTCAWPGCAKFIDLDGMKVIRVGSNHTFNYTVAGMLKAGLHKRLGADIVVEDLNKLPFFSPWVVKSPRLLMVHHFFGRTIFREASFPIASYVWLWEKLSPMIYKHEYVQSVSQDTTAELVGMGFERDKIRTIYNAVDSEAFRPKTEHEKPPFAYPYILYMGRVKKYKRLDLIIRAFAKVVGFGVDDRIRLVLAGGGDDYPRLKNLAAALGVAERCEFLGRVTEDRKKELFRHAILVANSSPKEGWGITNLEAAACGAPVVASRSPGLRESVAENEGGYLFEPGNVDEFAQLMLRVCEDPILAEQLSVGARKFAESFSWDKSAQETEEHLKFVLENWK